ncbi:site-specific integrase [Ileibacterium valens]|uniref:site-specific integrase n=1 Tax=Ileibacterium valens TaxID=1862668 RepID=UPI00272B90E9|nr:site-specific integrase [Ileibacterium valens]
MYFEKRESKKSKKGYVWQVCFYYIDPETGLRKRYKKSGFETKTEAQKHGQEAIKMLSDGFNLKDRRTLSDVYSEWLELNKERLAPGTVLNYRTYWQHLRPIASTSIRTLKYSTLQELFNQMDLSKDTKGNAKALLMNIFKHAIRSGYTDNNPAQYLVMTGKEKSPQNNALELWEVSDLCNQIKAHNQFTKQAYQTFVWIGYYSGLRASEILALEWPDVDLQKNTISISKQLNPKGIVTERLKTTASRAVVPLCGPLKEILINWKQINKEHELIVCRPSGDPMPHVSITQAIKRAGQRIGLDIHPHLLRHTFITNVVRSGADPKTAAQLARHSNISVTLNIYTQMNSEDLAAAIKTAFPESPGKAPESIEFQA